MIYLSISISSQHLIRGELRHNYVMVNPDYDVIIFLLRHYYVRVNPEYDVIIFLLRHNYVRVNPDYDVIIFHHRYVIILGLVSMRMKMVNHGFYFVEFWLLVGLFLKLAQIIQVGSLWPGNEMELDFETKVCPLKRNKGYLTRKWWWNYVFLKYYFRSA